jgi:FkbM family methyltransferase
MYLLKSKASENLLLSGLISPAVAAKRYWKQREMAPKIEIYNRLCEILVTDPVIRVDEFNGEFMIDKRSALFQRILTDGYYEPALVANCLQYIDRERDVIDVGANIGFYSVLSAKRIGSNRKVLAIEPTKNAFSRLSKNLEFNSVDSKVIAYNGVASNVIGEMDINTIPGKEEYSSIGVMEHPSIAKENYLSYTVPSSTLDSLVDTYGLNPGFVKIDVEGAEHLVLQGAHLLLTKYRPVILSEIVDNLLKRNGSSAQEVVDLIRSFGYKVINPIFPNLKLEDRPYGDILCIPE